MANDLFGGLGALGGLVSGLAKSGLVPTDTPEGKLLAAQSELSDLQKQESEILLEIGRQAYEREPSAWTQDAKLQLIRQNIEAARAALEETKQAQEAAKLAADAERQAREADNDKWRCPSCSHHNPEGVKFCQECGAKLGVSYCTGCGAELKPGARFCGECGARQGEA